MESVNPADILNALCERVDVTDKQGLDDHDYEVISSMTAADWLSWLDKQDGRNKLINFLKRTNNKHIIFQMEYHILALSSNDFSRLTDPLWSSVTKEDKRTVQSILTLPYPVVHGKNNLTFSEIHIPIILYELMKSVETAINILKEIRFDIFTSPQMLTFFDSTIQGININILKKHIPIHSSDLHRLRDKLTTLLFIVLHPEYHGKIKGLDVFINYMISVGTKDHFNTCLDDQYYINLKILGNSADNYLKKKLYKDANFIKIQNKAEEREWWNQICKGVFIDSIKYDYSNIILLNTILKDNSFFLFKMTTRAQNISLTSSEALMMWKQMSVKFAERRICKDSNETGYIAILFYQIIGVPCLDILASDRYVNELSDDDKELLTLWTHACNLLQKKTPTAESIATKSEMEELPDITRKSWLRNRLHQIFLQSPKTKQDIVLYRGINVHCDKVNKFSHNPVAVSYDKKVAQEFAGDGCVLEITIPKQSNILAIDRVSIYEGDESEVLLMPNGNLTITSEENQKPEKGKSISVISKVNEDANKNVIPLSKPSFVHKEMTLDEYKYILIKSGVVSNYTVYTTHVEILDVLTGYMRYDYSKISDFLFKAIRTWVLIYCGFGDVQLAISEFWKVSFSIYKDSSKMDTLNELKLFCDFAWATKKSLVTHNKAATSLDTLQEFVKPFLL